MKQTSHRIHLRKEAFKFSSAHMTVFPDGTKEAIHGHNYTVDVTISLKEVSLKKLLPFSVVKTKIREICDEWDEKLLLPEECPFLKKKTQSKGELEFLLCGKRYVLPQEEAIFLPLDNITAESLSEEFCRQLIVKLGSKSMHQTILEIHVRVDEFPGQGATCSWKR